MRKYTTQLGGEEEEEEPRGEGMQEKNKKRYNIIITYEYAKKETVFGRLRYYRTEHRLG